MAFAVMNITAIHFQGFATVDSLYDEVSTFLRLWVNIKSIDKLGLMIAVGSLILNLVAISVAIWHARKARTAAEAARDASTLTRKRIHGRLALVEAASCHRLIEIIDVYLKNGQFHPALIRLCDLISELVRFNELPSPQRGGLQSLPRSILTQLGLMREDLEQKLLDPDYLIDQLRMAKVLAETGDLLNSLAGKLIYGNHMGGRYDSEDLSGDAQQTGQTHRAQ